MQWLKTTVTALAVTAAAVTAAPVAAQTAPAAGTTPSNEMLSLGVMAGGQAVQNAAALFGVQLTRSFSDRISVVAEAAAAQNTATRRRIGSTGTIATYLQQTQGQTATGDLKAPTWIFEGGLRYTAYSTGAFRVFVQGMGGMSRVTLQPTFTLAGADITKSLPQYGVVLGSDLTGTLTKATFSGMVGVSHPIGRWAIEGAFGVSSVQTPGQAAKVVRAYATLSRGF